MQTTYPKFIALSITILSIFLIACGTKPSTSKAMEKITFDEPVTCNMPLGSRTVPAFFSFKSGRFNEKDYHGFQIAGKPLNNKVLMYYVITGNETLNITSATYTINNGVLKDSGTVTNNKSKIAYSYDFIIRCK